MAHPIYRTRGKERVPSVTTVLGKFKESGGLMYYAYRRGLDDLPLHDHKREAADIGTLAHEMAENYTKGLGAVTDTLPADINVDAAHNAYQLAGIDENRIVVAGTRAEAMSGIESGKKVVLESADLMLDLPIGECGC